MKLLTDIPAFGSDGDLNVVVETPKGSHNKYAYDEEFGAFRFQAVMPEGNLFPHDFGFVPSTLGEDGDPLDVLVLLDVSLPVGCLLSARPLGVIEAEQRERDGTVERNDRLLAVATKARTHRARPPPRRPAAGPARRGRGLLQALQRPEREELHAHRPRRPRAGARAGRGGRGGEAEEGRLSRLRPRQPPPPAL